MSKIYSKEVNRLAEQKDNADIKIRKPLLDVWTELDKNGRPRVYWEFGEGLICWPMIGILETIKLELLETVDEASE